MPIPDGRVAEPVIVDAGLERFKALDEIQPVLVDWRAGACNCQDRETRCEECSEGHDGMRIV